MILVNETPFSAELIRTTLSEQLMVATVVAKAGYAITGEGRLELLTRQRPVLRGPARLEGVDFPPDAGYGKRGVDLLAVATAFSPDGSPARALVAGISINNHHFGLAVIGDRRWQRRWPGWVASNPEPFVDMPITWARAFGGHARVEGGEVPCLDNAVGKGYILDPTAADGVELPNIEDPRQLIRDIEDRPRPVSFCPLPVGTSYAAEVLERVDDDGRGLSKEVFNVAIPAHRLPGYIPGARLRLHNLTSRPQPDFVLPKTKVVAQVSIGSAHHEFAGEVDTLLVLPSRRELMLTHRVVFRYDYARELPRVVRLRCSELEIGAAPREAIA
jgi:hypothetical protein